MLSARDCRNSKNISLTCFAPTAKSKIFLYYLIFAMLQVGKEMLCLNQQSEAEPDQASPGFSLLMELLRDDQ